MSLRRTVYRSSGFSLIELLVVMAIVAAVALVAAPWFFKISQRNQIKSAANEIQTTLLAARMIAVRRNQPVSVRVVTAAPTEDKHVLETIEPPPPAGTPTPVPRRIEIAKKTINFVSVPAGNLITFVGDGRMTSFPAPTPAVVVVEGPAGAASPNQITIETTNSGRVKVITPTTWN